MSFSVTPADRNDHDDVESLAYLPVEDRDSHVSSVNFLFPQPRDSLHVDSVPPGVPPTGLFVQYAAIGCVVGLFQVLAYPFFKIYLNMDEYAAKSAEQWMALPWILKLGFAAVTDFVPVRGLRRKPYLYAGWGVCLLATLLIAVLPMEAAYSADGVVNNANAASAGPKYIVFFVLANVGLVLAHVASDGIMVAVAHHEAQDSSTSSCGYTVTRMFAFRALAQCLTELLVGLLCNDDSFGGSFGWAMPVNVIVILAMLASLAAIAATWFWIDEYYIAMTLSLRECVRSLWKISQQRAIWQLMIYTFITRICFSYYASSAKAIYEYWVPVAPLTSNLFTAINAGVYAGAAMLMQHSWFVHLGWRRTVFLSVIASSLVTFISTLFTAFNLLRFAFFLLTFEQIAAVCEALAYYIVLFAIVDVAEPGYESSCFNLITSVGNLGIVLAVTLSQSIGVQFDLEQYEYENDSGKARRRVFFCVLVMLVVRLLNIAALPLLPDHKQHAMELKKGIDSEGRKRHRRPALYVFSGMAVVALWAVLMTLLSSFENTACLPIAGGDGC